MILRKLYSTSAVGIIIQTDDLKSKADKGRKEIKKEKIRLKNERERS